MFAIQEAKINANAKELCKENTRRAYDPKQIEFWNTVVINSVTKIIVILLLSKKFWDL